MAIYSVSVPIFSVLTMIVSVRGQSQVVANVQDNTPCYGSIVNVTCSFPEDPKKLQYVTSTPSWKRNGDLYQPDAITHTIINENSTLHILSISLTGEDLLSNTSEYTCYLVKKDGELDESEVHIAPQERPLAPVIRNVTLSEEGTTVSWDHDTKCFRSCSFTYNVNLSQVTEGGNSIFMNTTSTAQLNVTFVNLIVNETYKLLVIAQSICANVSTTTLTSKPLEVEFEGKEYSTPSPPTKIVATVPLMTESPADESNRVAIIVGVVVPVVVLVLFTAIVIVIICICFKRRNGKEQCDGATATNTTNVELYEKYDGRQGRAVIYDGGEDSTDEQIDTKVPSYGTLQELKQFLLQRKDDEEDNISVIMRPTCWKELRKQLLNKDRE